MKTLRFTSSKSIDEVKAHLLDAAKFVAVHPLIYRMDAIGNQTFRVYEQVKFGFVPYRFTYTAVIKHEADAVIIEATISRFTKLAMHFTFSSENHRTVINEQLQIESPLPIHRFMQRLILKQHQHMFDTIDKQ